LKYIVEKIVEPDFGCEGIPDGQTAMDRVVLKAEDGQETARKVSDKELYDKDINEGDTVCFDSENLIVKCV